MMGMNEPGDEVRAVSAESGEILVRVQLPIGVTGTIVGEGDPKHTVVFDRLGRSPDYEVSLAASDRVVRWAVAGLTGAARESDP